MKLTIPLIIFTLITTHSYGQSFNAGVTAGISASQINGDGYGGFHKPGIILGGFTNTTLSDKWSAQFDMYFIAKGSHKIPRPDKGDITRFYAHINYTEISLAAQYKYKILLLEFGPYLSTFMSYKMKNENGAVFINKTTPFNRLELGGFLGVSYQINERFSFNIRSTTSITPSRNAISKDSGNWYYNLFRYGWYNVTINNALRYQFNSSKSNE